jgi:hypothetical protein
MNAIAARVSEALPILASVWSNSRSQACFTAVKWLYSPSGAEAFIDFAIRMEMMPESAHHLVREIFQLRCEIAARQAGWCPELETPAHASGVEDADY